MRTYRAAEGRRRRRGLRHQSPSAPRCGGCMFSARPAPSCWPAAPRGLSWPRTPRACAWQHLGRLCWLPDPPPCSPCWRGTRGSGCGRPCAGAGNITGPGAGCYQLLQIGFGARVHSRIGAIWLRGTGRGGLSHAAAVCLQWLAWDRGGHRGAAAFGPARCGRLLRRTPRKRAAASFNGSACRPCARRRCPCWAPPASPASSGVHGSAGAGQAQSGRVNE
jgi:hypothetical protein